MVSHCQVNFDKVPTESNSLVNKEVVAPDCMTVLTIIRTLGGMKASDCI